MRITKFQMESNINILVLLGFGLWCLMSLSISVISWQSVLLVEETEVPGENH